MLRAYGIATDDAVTVLGTGNGTSETAHGANDADGAARAVRTAVRAGGPPPIPYDELFEVSRWAIRLAHDARARAPV